MYALEFGPGEGGVGQLGAFEDRERQISAVKLRPDELGAPEVGLGQVQLPEVHTAEIRVDQIGSEGRVLSPPLVPPAGAELGEMIWIGH